MARNAGSFKRRDSRFKQQATVLVLCEDIKSGKKYLEDAALHFRSNAKIEIAHCGVTHPLGIVQQAVARQNFFDKVYCAIDRDTHESFDDAIRLAHNHSKIEVIASYPCFEYWLLLHFGYTRKPFSRSGKRSAGDNLGAELRQKPGMEDYQKSGSRGYFKILSGAPFELARKESPRALADALKNGERNPSTEMHLLIDAFEALSKPTLI